jgi:transposase
MKNMADLQQENEELRNALADSKAKVDSLKEQIRAFLAQRFGTSSEKISPDQINLFNEAESLVEDDQATEINEADISVKSHQRSRKPRVSIPEAIPREDIVYDLPENEKVCPHDGSPLKAIGSDDHEQLDIIPAQIKVLRHRRLKYACPCCDQHIVTANKPKQPIEKSIASAGLLAFVATQKYCDALPLYRQSEMFKRIGIEMDRTNLANWMVKMGELTQPLIDQLTQHLQQQTLLHLDETTLQVLDEPGKSAQSKSYLWLMASFTQQPATVFHYSPSRSQETPNHLLSKTTQAIMVDGYDGYQPACDQYQITRLGCWAHARRKFMDAKKVQSKGKTGKADQAIAYIQKLYRIETKTKDEPPERRYGIRQNEAIPIIADMKKWMDKSLLTVVPSSQLGKALTYLNNQWERLTGYLEDGSYPIDNNAAERGIRPFTIGRKNWMFAKSQAGAQASANLYSLVETAKANDLNPYDYLKYIFAELPSCEEEDDIKKLLPWNAKLN